MNPAEVLRASYVLIVEDEVALATQLSELIRVAGYQSVTAHNGRLAREVLESRAPPCLILLDLLMPELDGFGLLKALRADPECSRIPVCVISALSADALAPGDVTEALRKPIDSDRLLSVVQRHCRRS